MAQYSISDLKNKITDRIHENHERAITGPDLQEILHDVLDSLAASSGSILDIFPGWHGDEFSASATFYHYLGEYYISGVTPTKLYIRAKSPDGAGSIIVHIRAESASNENVGSDSLTLVEEYSLFEIDLVAAVFGEPLMIQYKSNQNFQVKEIIIL
jgi:hypothetical protein